MAKCKPNTAVGIQGCSAWTIDESEGGEWFPTQSTLYTRDESNSASGRGYGEGTEGEVTEKEKVRIRMIPPRKTLLNYYATWMHGEGVFYCNLCDFRTNEPGNYEAYEKILEHIHSAHPEEVATQDYSEAVKWYRKAAEQGLPEAQYALGFMYGKSQGVPQDYVFAHMWLNLATLRFPASEKKNQEMANKDRDITASEMTPAQITEARRLARQWKPKKER